MNQSAFIRRIARTTGLPQTVTDSILKAAAGVIAESLAAGESVKFPGLGTFEAHVSAPRVMRLNLLANPETRTVGGKRRARFRASSAFAAAVEFRKD